MLSRTNAMSALGRMSWGTHMLIYPTILGAYIGAYKPYAKKQEEAGVANEYEIMCKAKDVDPDHFNPFTPIPFNNNPELKYMFAHINLRHYVNEHHINEKDYEWKGYHNSFDHNNKKSYQWNWSSI